MKITRMTRPIVDWLTQQRPAPEFPLSDFERIRYEVRPCDVLLIEGRTRVSDVIKMITQSPWSHAALYLGRLHDIEDPELRNTLSELFPFSPDTQLIVESELGMGTVVRDLASYRQDHIRICRPRGISHKDCQQMTHYAISQLGKEYDVRQILDLARFLFPWWIMPRRWRSSLFLHNAGKATKTVCSTMIAEAFGFIQFPILPLVKRDGEQGIQLFRRNPKLCTPRDFDYSPYFEIIKYPFMDFSYHEDYRLLPWHGKGILDNQEAALYVYPEGQTTEQPPGAEKAAPTLQELQVEPESGQKPEPEPKPEPKNNGENVTRTDRHKKVALGSKAKKAPYVAFTSPQSDADFYDGDYPPGSEKDRSRG